MKRWYAIVTFMIVLKEVHSHGRLMVPPQRSSLWRTNPAAPKNYNDMGLNCGGLSYQWDTHNGKCGFCGDPYGSTTKPNQGGGKYDNGVIGRKYNKGQMIDVVVEITANHKGWFEFRLCDSRSLSDKCFNENLLYISTHGRRYSPGTKKGNHNLKVELPKDVTCSNCVLQWKYNAGNSWGCDGPGNTYCGIGYGKQEQFINCADISIIDASPKPATTKGPTKTSKSTKATPPTTTTTVASTATTTTASTKQLITTPTHPTTTTAKTTRLPKTKSVTTTTKESPKTTRPTIINPPSPVTTTTKEPPKTTRPTIINPPSPSKKKCVSLGPFSTLPGMDSWCTINCNIGKSRCPPFICKCDGDIEYIIVPI